MIRAAELMHGFNQGADMLWRRELRNAVTEIEHMTGTLSELMQHLAYLGGDGGGRTEQHIRIEIALQSDLVADALPRLADINSPVEAHGVAADGSDVFQP